MELILIASVISGVSIMLVIIGITEVRSHKSVRERLSAYLVNDSEPVTVREVELSMPFAERVVLPMLRGLNPAFGWMWPPARLARLRKRLVMAGNPGGMAAAEFVTLKGIVAAVFLGIALTYTWFTQTPFDAATILVMMLFVICGFFLPDFWLSRSIRLRQTGLINSLPDALDMLSITVEAGLSFESGIQEITNKWKNELSREFNRLLRDIGAGVPRRQALLDLAARTDVPELNNFVTSLNQAEELGVSIRRVLQVQADEMRTKRRQRAQERANQAPVKMLFPLVFLVFPAIFAVLLGPALAQILDLM